MSIEYREETTRTHERLIAKRLKEAPPFVSDFYEHMHGGKREISTQAAYIADICSFIEYEYEILKSSIGDDIRQFPLDIFYSLTVKDLNEYRAYLREVRLISNSSAKKKFAAISAFYAYLNAQGLTQNNPMQTFEVPAISKKRIIKLDAKMSARLQEGVLRNDMYLSETVEGKVPLPILDAVWSKREPHVLRNYAIITLFLGAGLRVSELVGLDLNDISFKRSSLRTIVKGGDETEIYFGEEVLTALKTYIYGPEISDYKEFCENQAPGSLLWVKENSFESDFKVKLREKYPDKDPRFYNSMIILSSAARRYTRADYNPKRNCDAVFISYQGGRMSVRSVERMIKEMVQTYLPDYDDKDIFSPHKLRATCATRILAQTGNLELCSTQLNHKNLAVTSQFYAELQKEKRQDIVKSLDIHKW